MFRLTCHLANPGTKFAIAPAAGLSACMTKRANTGGFVSVNFSTGDKVCYMRNYQQPDHITPGPHNSANLYDESHCPGSDEETIRQADGRLYKIFCGKG